MESSKVAEIIASFFGGSLFTAIVFVFAFTSKVTVMQATLAEVCKKIDSHIANAPTCEFHRQLEEDVIRLKSKVNLDGY